jgi:hypothetical protein
VEQHLAPPEAMAGGQNMLVDPIAGGAFKRSGFAIAGGDVVSGATNHATNGILESGDPAWIPYRVRQFYSTALLDGQLNGYPTYSALYGRVASSPNWPTIDNGMFGTEYVRRPDANYSLLSEFGSASYPTDGGSGGGAFATSGIYYKVVPFWYESGEGGYNRGAHEFARRFVASGSWGTVDAGRWRYYPNLHGTPIMWDGGCNDSSSDVVNSVRVRPTGPFGPLWPPVVATGTASAARTYTTADSDYPWLEGDTFFISVMFQFEDGSYSLPCVPRMPNTILTSGFGFVTVGAATQAGGSKYKYKTLTYSNIPIGPPGTIARVLLRSQKQNRVAATDAITVDISDLRILGVVRNNTQTTYSDTLADDDGLLEDTDVVRWDLTCPPRSRYLGTGDQRVIAGYTLPNPSAIQLACIGIAVDYDKNTSTIETLEAPGAISGCYRITSAAVELINATGGAISGTLTIDFATYDTVQKVVDKINSTAVGSNYGQWRAQVAPGADPNAGSSGLCLSVISVANCEGAGSAALSTTGDGSSVPIGYKCYSAAAGMTDGTLVKTSNYYTSGSHGWTLDQACSVAAGSTVVFYADCGDGACVTVAGSKGWIRTFSGAYPGMIYFKRSAMEGYNRPRKDRIYFTISSPGAAATGVSVAANSWGASNRRDGVDGPGQLMGIVDVDGAAVLLYRNRIGLFVNERGSNTGEDFDYRIKTINGRHGCVSPWSVVTVAGCAVYATAIGIKAADKSRREILLSSEIYQPARSLGDLAYELPLCVAAAAQDSYNCWMGGVAWGSRLVYSYRREANVYGFIVYDFSTGMDQLGIEALANPETRSPYGWSTMCQLDSEIDAFGPRAMGAVEASGGTLLYGAINDNSGVTDGRIDQMFTGDTDNGVSIIGSFSSRRVLADPGMRFVAMGATVLHRVGYASTELSVIRTDTGSAADTASLTSSGSNELNYERLQWEQVARSPAKLLQVFYYDSQSSTGGIVFKIDQGAEILQKVGD